MSSKLLGESCKSVYGDIFAKALAEALQQTHSSIIAHMRLIRLDITVARGHAACSIAKTELMLIGQVGFPTALRADSVYLALVLVIVIDASAVSSHILRSCPALLKIDEAFSTLKKYGGQS